MVIRGWPVTSTLHAWDRLDLYCDFKTSDGIRANPFVWYRNDIPIFAQLYRYPYNLNHDIYLTLNDSGVYNCRGVDTSTGNVTEKVAGNLTVLKGKSKLFMRCPPIVLFPGFVYGIV